MSSASKQELLQFPCHFEFKAFGPGNDDVFIANVQAAVSKVVPVSRQAMKSRLSSAGRYQCVTVIVTLMNQSQLEGVYAEIRKIGDLKYLL